MKAAGRIRKELFTIMSAGDATTCRIWKGWGKYGRSYGWWYTVNGVDVGLGFSADKAVKCIRDLRESAQKSLD